MTDPFARFRAIALALPNAAEELTWGHPTFRIGGKIFTTMGSGPDGNGSCSFKTDKPHQAELVARPGFTVADYVGRHGWVTQELTEQVDWAELEAHVRGSFRMIAPARLVKMLK